jgi:hypothetical protein
MVNGTVFELVIGTSSGTFEFIFKKWLNFEFTISVAKLQIADFESPKWNIYVTERIILNVQNVDPVLEVI